MLFGPVTLFAVVALVTLVICKMIGTAISWTYALAIGAVLFGICYWTLCILRLRWS